MCPCKKKSIANFLLKKSTAHTGTSCNYRLTFGKQAQFAVWNTCLPNVCLKILMFVAFAKMKNLSAETFCKSYYLVCANWACLLLAAVFLLSMVLSSLNVVNELCLWFA